VNVRMWGGGRACHSTDAPIPSPSGGIGRAGAVSCASVRVCECEGVCVEAKDW
jgi:hypothetical protein